MMGYKNKDWKPEILEQIMLAAASGEAKGLTELTLKIIALAAGIGMPKPSGLSFPTGEETEMAREREAKLEWVSGNERTLNLWIQTDGKIRFQSGVGGKDSELVKDAPVAFVTHIFHAWTAA